MEFQNTEPDEKFSITATHILEYLYCPRFTYFEESLKIPEYQNKRFKVQKGRQVHKELRKRNPHYLRKRIAVAMRKSDMYISSGHLRGIIDDILFFSNGTAAPLDYKYAVYKKRTFKNHIFQLVLYGKLIQDTYDVSVGKGFIVYTRSKNKLIEFEITHKMYLTLDQIVASIKQIIQYGFYPEATKYKMRCIDCCYRNICEQII